MCALQNTDLERIARRRAGARLGWYIHACVYIAVNLGLATISAMSGRHWVNGALRYCAVLLLALAAAAAPLLLP